MSKHYRNTILRAKIIQEMTAKHYEPEIKRRFVGIGFAVVGKSEDGAVPQRLVGYAEIPQFVGRRHVPHEHYRDEGYCHQDECAENRMRLEY